MSTLENVNLKIAVQMKMGEMCTFLVPKYAFDTDDVFVELLASDFGELKSVVTV